MTPICSSRSFKNMECSPFIIEPPIPEDDLGAKVRIASHPGCKSILLFLENSPKCIFLFPTTDLVPAWILRSYIVFVVKLFKYILKWKMKSCNNNVKRVYLWFFIGIFTERFFDKAKVLYLWRKVWLMSWYFDSKSFPSNFQSFYISNDEIKQKQYVDVTMWNDVSYNNDFEIMLEFR